MAALRPQPFLICQRHACGASLSRLRAAERHRVHTVGIDCCMYFVELAQGFATFCRRWERAMNSSAFLSIQLRLSMLIFSGSLWRTGTWLVAAGCCACWWHCCFDWCHRIDCRIGYSFFDAGIGSSIGSSCTFGALFILFDCVSAGALSPSSLMLYLHTLFDHERSPCFSALFNMAWAVVLKSTRMMQEYSFYFFGGIQRLPVFGAFAFLIWAKKKKRSAHVKILAYEHTDLNCN